MTSIRVLFDTKTIVISSAFHKKALVYGTPEYDQLQNVRRDYPDFVLTVRQFKKNSKQEHYRGLTYDYMREHISKVEGSNAPAVLADFEALVDVSKCHSTSKRYPTIKAWFLNRYPAVANFGLDSEIVSSLSPDAESKAA